MSVYLTPVTFEGAHIAPSDDGSAWAACTTDGISSGCAMAISSGSLTIAAGKLIASGRTAKLDSGASFTLSSYRYDRLVLTIDLSKSAEEQVALDLQSNDSLSGFPALTQGDINGNDTKYQAIICVVDNNQIVWRCDKAHSKGFGITVALPAANWVNNEQSVYVNGVLADTNVIVSAAPANQAAWEAAGVYAYSQQDFVLTFRCTTTPSATLNANVLLY